MKNKINIRMPCFIVHFITVYVISLTLLLLCGFFSVIFGGMSINGHAYSLFEYIIQLIFIIINIALVVVSNKLWVKIIMMINIGYLSFIQGTVYITLGLFCVLGIVYIMTHIGSKKTIICGVVSQIIVCLISIKLSLVFYAEPFEFEVHRKMVSPDNEYQIQSLEVFDFTGSKIDSYYECMKNNDIYLLFYRLEHRQDIGVFDLGKEDVPVYWIDEKRFFINGVIYSVDDIPIHVSTK